MMAASLGALWVFVTTKARDALLALAEERSRQPGTPG